MIVLTGCTAAAISKYARKHGIACFWAECLPQGVPRHPAEVIDFVESELRNGRNIATMSEAAICTVQRMIRLSAIPAASVDLRYICVDGTCHKIGLDIKGEFIHPFPEDDGFRSIIGHTFYLRYH